MPDAVDRAPRGFIEYMRTKWTAEYDHREEEHQRRTQEVKVQRAQAKALAMLAKNHEHYGGMVVEDDDI